MRAVIALGFVATTAAGRVVVERPCPGTKEERAALALSITADGDGMSRADELTFFASCATSEELQALLHALSGRDLPPMLEGTRLRFEAELAVARAAPESALELLRSYLAPGHPTERARRQWAVGALMDRGDVASIPLIQATLARDSGTVPEAFTVAAEWTRTAAGGLPAVTRALHDSSPAIKNHAVRWLLAREKATCHAAFVAYLRAEKEGYVTASEIGGAVKQEWVGARSEVLGVAVHELRRHDALPADLEVFGYLP
jgi:hypothetical protein